MSKCRSSDQVKRHIALAMLLLVAHSASADPVLERVSDAHAPSAMSSDVRDLPLVEVPAAKAGDTLALLITGAGGWAALDRTLSAELARQGTPVIGLSSPEYFWHARTPEVTTRDIAQVLRHYLEAWHRSRIVLIGYSFGADVLPFVVNRLPQELRARVITVNLLGLGPNAAFEFSVEGLIHSDPAATMPVVPELDRIRNVPVLCVYGDGEQESLCPSLPSGTVSTVRLGTGHHFGNEYEALAQQVTAFAARAGS